MSKRSFAERGDGVVDVGLDEAGIEAVSEAKPVGRLDRGPGEVEAGNRGAGARP